MSDDSILSTSKKKPEPLTGAASFEDLATELHTIMRQALEKFGLDLATQAKAYSRSLELDKPITASGDTMRTGWGLSGLLMEWSRAAEYVDSDGQPKVIKIKGAGATFESLAKRFLPDKTLDESIDIARARAEVERLSRGRIALLGGIAVNTAVSKQILLAHAVRHLDHLLQTLLHNLTLQNEEERNSAGRMERMVLGAIRKDKFSEFMALFRPQIYDLLLQVDGAVEQRGPVSEEEIQDSTGVVVGVYVSQEPDWDRMGIDPKLLIPTRR